MLTKRQTVIRDLSSWLVRMRYTLHFHLSHQAIWELVKSESYSSLNYFRILSQLQNIYSFHGDVPSTIIHLWLKMIIWVIGVLRRTVVGDWRFDNLRGSHLDSKDGFRTGCRNVSRQQQSFSGLQSPKWSFSIKVCYSWVQTIFVSYIFYTSPDLNKRPTDHQLQFSTWAELQLIAASLKDFHQFLRFPNFPIKTTEISFGCRCMEEWWRGS